MDTEGGQAVARQIRGLRKRKGSYQWRRRIPDDLQPKLKLSEITRRLEPGDDGFIREQCERWQAWGTAYFNALRRGDPPPTEPYIQPAAKGSRKKPSLDPNRPCVSEVFRRFREEKDPAHFQRSSQLLNEVAEWVLVSVVGADTPIGDIDREQMKTVMQTVRGLPKNRSSRRALDRKTPQECVKLAQENDWPVLAPKTVNSYHDVYTAVWGWAEAFGYARAAVVSTTGLRSREDPARSQRDAFSVSEQQTIINTCSGFGETWKWLFLLGILTGARLNEVCELYAEHINPDPDSGINRIQFCHDISGKTDAAKRDFPVSEQLERLGFLDWVHARKGHLFPDLKRSAASGTLSTEASKKASRLLKKMYVKGDRKSFHSLRHSWLDAARSGKLTYEHREYLIGHTLGGVAGRYGETFFLDDLKTEVEKLKFRCDFSALEQLGGSAPQARKGIPQTGGLNAALPDLSHIGDEC